MNRLGERIKELRTERGLSQLELAALVGVHQTQISRVESGLHGITLATAIDLARALGITVNELIPNDNASETTAQEPSCKQTT